MVISDRQRLLLHLAVIPRQTALRGLLVKRRYVLAGLFHRFHDLVERHAMMAVGEGRVDVGVEGTGSGIGVTLDTRNL